MGENLFDSFGVSQYSTSARQRQTGRRSGEKNVTSFRRHFAPFFSTQLWVIILLFFGLAYSNATIVSLLVVIAVATLSLAGTDAERNLRWTLATPFVFVVLVTFGASFFQETLSEAYNLMRLAMIYVLARLLRGVIDFDRALVGLAAVGLFVAVVHQANIYLNGDAPPLIEDLAELTLGRPPGAVLGFSVIALLALGLFRRNERGTNLMIRGLWVTSFLLLAISDVMSSLIGAGIAVVVMVLVLLWRNKIPWLSRRVSKGFSIGVLSVVAGIALLGLAVNLIGPSNYNPLLQPLDRDFLGLTGRRSLWECYIAVVGDSSVDRWAATLDCAKYPHANLHSSYLQAHLLAGNVGLLAIVFGFGVSIALAFKRVSEASAEISLRESLASLGIILYGTVTAFSESYMFVSFFPAFLVFFFAPSIRGVALKRVRRGSLNPFAQRH